MGYRYFASPSTRGNAGEPFGDHWSFAHGVARQYDFADFFFRNVGSFSERGSAHGRPFQKSEGPFNRASGDGRARLGYRY
jgi:hypothetical protein